MLQDVAFRFTTPIFYETQILRNAFKFASLYDVTKKQKTLFLFNIAISQIDIRHKCREHENLRHEFSYVINVSGH